MFTKKIYFLVSTEFFFKNFFLTEEDAVKAMLKEMDKCMLYYKYKECTQAFTLIDEKIVRNKQVTYRNEWTVVTLVNE